MIAAVLKFDPAGNGHGLFTEAIDLSALGTLEIVRASSIEFNNHAQRWEVKSVEGSVLSALATALTLVMPVNHKSDSADQIQRLADQFCKHCGYVVVRNAAHSDSFALFESSEVRAQRKDKLGGRERPFIICVSPIRCLIPPPFI